MTTPIKFQFNPSRVELDPYNRCEFCGQTGAPLRRVTDSHSRRQCWNSAECLARQSREAAAMSGEVA